MEHLILSIKRGFVTFFWFNLPRDLQRQNINHLVSALQVIYLLIFIPILDPIHCCACER